MEQHAVPRNITGFKFRLIGDMTLRQFGYLAIGVLSAYITYKISPLPPIVTFPLTGIMAFAGFAFAFLPIQERPLDTWLLAFIKSILSPTQYLWHKELFIPEVLAKSAVVHVKTLPPVHRQAHQDANSKLRAYLRTLPATPHQSLNVKEKKYIDKTLSLFQGSSVTSPMNQPISPPVPPPPKPPPPPPVVPKPKTEALGDITPPQTRLLPPQPLPVSSDSSLTNELTRLKKQLAELSLEKEKLAKELTDLKQNIPKAQGIEVIKPEIAKEKKEPTIKKVTARAAVDELGMPSLPQVPNIVIGVIKDAQKRILPNIILTIKDSEGQPLRALKTNKLGQFITATPLPNGTYYLEVEDPLKRYVFDVAEITLSGNVLLPVEITAKGEKELIREKLTKELFGTSKPNSQNAQNISTN